MIVIDKPAGLPVLPDGWESDAPYLLKMLEEQFHKIWVVHRLDKITSGVMLFALTADAHRALNRQFELHEVEKVYLALVEGNPAWEQHTARHMLQANIGRKHRTVVVRKKGKPSETHFRVLQRGLAGALVEARPKTGRTHQVRVHLSALGHPLLGDVLYGAQATDWISRPALHAASLTFDHPITAERLTFTAPAPDDFQMAMERTLI